MSSMHRFRKAEETPKEDFIRIWGPRALLTNEPVVIYVRQSQMAKAVDHRVSRELQSKDFIEHAMKLGWRRELIEVYDDTGLTAVLGINDRERLLDMYEDIKRGHIKTVLIYIIDLLSPYNFLTKAMPFVATYPNI